MIQTNIEEKITEYPICEYAFIHTEDILFYDRVRYICETECPRYGTSWSCPPAVGTVAECEERCRRYRQGFLFTTVAEVSDMMNMEEMLSTRMEHEEITREIVQLFRAEGAEPLTLSTESCAACKTCTYPGAPCRKPDRMFPCIESHGIVVSELAEKYGISFLNGAGVVTWFSLLLF